MHTRLPGRGLPIHNRERINLDEITRRKRGDPDDGVGRLVIAEQRHSSVFDDRQMAITLVIDNVDRNLCHVFGKGTGGCKGSAKVGEHLACLNRQITGAYKLAIDVLRFLTSDKYELGPPCDNDLSVGRRGR